MSFREKQDLGPGQERAGASDASSHCCKPGGCASHGLPKEEPDFATLSKSPLGFVTLPRRSFRNFGRPSISQPEDQISHCCNPAGCASHGPPKRGPDSTNSNSTNLSTTPSKGSSVPDSGISLGSDDNSKNRNPDFADDQRSVTSCDTGYGSSVSSVSSSVPLCDACPKASEKKCVTCRSTLCARHVEEHSRDLPTHQLQDLKETENPENNLSKPSENKGVPPPGPIEFDSVQHDSLSLKWPLPKGAPGSFRFKVQWKGGQKERTLTVGGGGLRVTELTPGERYHFMVATVDKDGHESAWIDAFTHTEIPTPQNVKVEQKLQAADVTWTAAGGGNDVTYHLEIFRNDQRVDIMDTKLCSYTIKNLQPPAQYKIQVSTVWRNNNRQSKPVSATFSTEIPCPQNLQVNSRLHKAAVKWTKPAGLDNVAYLLEIFKDGELVDSFNKEFCSHTIDLQPPADYKICVSTIVNGGQSKPVYKRFRTEVQAPQNVQVNSKLLTATVKWTKPTGVDNATYLIEIYKNKELHDTINKDQCSHTANLLPPAKYKINVSTISNGVQSTPVSKTFKTEIPPPQNVTVNTKLLTATVKWTKPAGLDSASYRLEIYRNEELLHTVNIGVLEHTFPELPYQSDYKIQICTVLNNCYESAPVCQTFGTEIPAPEGLTVKVSDESAILTWKVSPKLKQTPHSFQVSCQSAVPGAPCNSLTTTSCGLTIAGLKTGTLYNVKVCTVLQNGEKSMPASDIIKAGILKIVLLGSFGVGKSASGNTILGREVFKSELSGIPVTSDCQTKDGEVDGRNICVIDTPGLFNAQFRADSSVKKQILRSIPQSPAGPPVLLLTITDKVKLEEQKIVQCIQDIFGKESVESTIVLITHGDSLEEKGQSVEAFLRNSSKHSAIVAQCGQTYHVFNNENRENRSQVTELIKKIDKMMAKNRDSKCSSN